MIHGSRPAVKISENVVLDYLARRGVRGNLTRGVARWAPDQLHPEQLQKLAESVTNVRLG